MLLSHPIPTNENQRLTALDRLQIVGSSRSPDFNSLLALALELTGCRAGLIGLMEADRHWFKAEIGIGQLDMPRWVSLGNHTLLQTEPLIVEDLTRDARFRNNPLVKERGVHFYAGVALAAPTGENIGTLCLTDRSPRAAEPVLYDVLRDLGRIAEGMLSSHAKTVAAMETAEVAEIRHMELWRKTRLLEQSERLAKVGAWELDLETQVITSSAESLRFHGLGKDDVLTLDDIRARMEPGLRSRATALLDRCAETGEGYEYNGEFFTVQGESRWIQVLAEAEHRDGRVVRIFGTGRDRTTDHQVERDLWLAAHHDVLTETPNRRYWSMRLNEAVARAVADQSVLTILLFDLDAFKEINDVRGHAAGDQVLREVSRRLIEALPAGAFHARLGGDEFAVLFEGGPAAADLDRLLPDLLDAIRRPLVIDGSSLRISGTFGSARCPDDASSASDLMRKADIALHQAKQSGCLSYVAYTSEIGGLFEQKRRAIDIVTTAIDEKRLVAFYQPKIDLRTGALIGFEASCRIETAMGTILPPSAFEPALLDPVSSVRIGAAVLEKVTADIAEWSAEGLAPGRITLHLTGADFADGTLAGRILDRLAALEIPPSVLEIELTEKTILGKEAACVDAALRALEEHGVSIGLDDFGIGYGSLNELCDAPIKYIKLDRSFVTGLDQTGDNSIIVRSIVDLAHALSMRVIAEGIETMTEAGFVRAVGCDEAQGPLFATPISSARTRATLVRMRQASHQSHERQCA